MTHTYNISFVVLLRLLDFEVVSTTFTATKFNLEYSSFVRSHDSLSKTIGFFNFYFTHYAAYGTDYEREQAGKYLNEIPRMRSLLKRKQVGMPGLDLDSVNPQTVSHD